MSIYSSFSCNFYILSPVFKVNKENYYINTVGLDYYVKVYTFIFRAKHYWNKYVCVSVCLSVCLSVHEHIHLPNHTRDLYQIFARVSYGRGSVLLRRGDEIPNGRGQFWGFLPHWQFIVQYSSWDPDKNGWTDRDAVLDEDSRGPEEPYIRRGADPQGKGQFSGVDRAIQKHWQSSLRRLRQRSCGSSLRLSSQKGSFNRQ